MRSRKGLLRDPDLKPMSKPMIDTPDDYFNPTQRWKTPEAELAHLRFLGARGNRILTLMSEIVLTRMRLDGASPHLDEPA